MGGSFLRALDLYGKIPKDLTESTPQGATFSVAACICMAFLFLSEIYAFFYTPWETSVIVHRPFTTMEIRFNISMLDLPCEYASVDVLDILGTNRMNVTKNINRWRLSPKGVLGAYKGKTVKKTKITIYDEMPNALEKLHEDGIHAVPLNEENFISWLEEHEYTFVDFYAPWCVWCQRLAPTWEALAEAVERMGMPCSVVQIDCDANSDLCTDSKIQAFPTMRLFHRMESLVDYDDDRSIDALMRFLARESSKPLKDGTRTVTGELKLKGAHDDIWPGCVLSGTLVVNQIPGNFHVEAKSDAHEFNSMMTNLSHVVHSFIIGDYIPPRLSRKLSKLPKEYVQMTPLDDQAFIVDSYHQSPHHFIKIVGTEYHLSRKVGDAHYGYQLLSYDQIMYYPETAVPEAKFSYDISPMAVKVSKQEYRWYSFTTRILALIGGTFSVIGLVDSFFWRARSTRKTKPTIAR